MKLSIIDLTDTIVARLNKQLKESEANLIFELAIKKSTAPLPIDDVVINQKKGGHIARTKSIRKIYFYRHNLLTGKREVLYENTFTPVKASDLIKKDFKSILYREFLYGCVGIFSLNMEDITKKEEAISHKYTEDPLTPEEAQPSNIQE